MPYNLPQRPCNNVTCVFSAISAVSLVVGLGMLQFTCGNSSLKNSSNTLTPTCKFDDIHYTVPVFASTMLFALMAVANEKFKLSERASVFFSRGTPENESASLLNDGHTPQLTV